MGNQRGLLNVSADHVYDGAHIILQQVILVVGDIRLQVLKNSPCLHMKTIMRRLPLLLINPL